MRKIVRFLVLKAFTGFKLNGKFGATGLKFKALNSIKSYAAPATVIEKTDYSAIGT